MKASDAVYLEDMIEALQRIVKFAPAQYEDFVSDMQARQAIERNFEILGEAAKRLSSQTEKIYPDVPWREMKGMRDKLIHAYDMIDIKILWSAVQDAARVLALLEKKK